MRTSLVKELAHKFLNLYCSILKELALRAGDSISEYNHLWGCSSAGRAPALQAGGQEFDSPHLHQITLKDFKCLRVRDVL